MKFIEGFNKVDKSGNELKKHRQRKKILHLLYNHKMLAGTSIANKLGVSLPTVLFLLNELVELGYIEPCGTGLSRGGRKPLLYRLSGNSFYVIACELGRYEGKITICNAHNETIVPITYFETSIDDNALVDRIYEISYKLIEENAIGDKRIVGIGLTMPGLVDEVNGVNNTIKNKEFRNVRERLEAKFKKLVYINNDARMQAYGEYVFGKARGHDNAIVINWSYGIGLGMILDGKLYNGAAGFAGELSHTKFVEDGDLCICGKRGCLETIASANFLLKKAMNGIRSGIVSQLILAYKEHPEELKPNDVVLSARSGDEFSISLLNQIGYSLGKGLAFTIQLLNPDIIVLCGEISGAKQFVLTPIQQSLNKYYLEQISSNIKVVISEN